MISTCSAMGYLASQRLAERSRLLKLWIWVLELIKTEICFQSRLLPEVFCKVADWCGDPEVGRAFSELAAAVGYGSAREFSDVWQGFVTAEIWRALKPPELQTLRELGTFLGSTGREDQLVKLNACRSLLEQLLQAAETEQRQQTGLYRYFGFAAGVTLVLWLG